MQFHARHIFPSVVRRTRSEELGVAASQPNTSRREIMGNRKAIKDINGNTHAAAGATARDLEFEADVLFQRIYDKWYAFSVIDDDCLVTEVAESEVQKRMARKTIRAA